MMDDLVVITYIFSFIGFCAVLSWIAMFIFEWLQQLRYNKSYREKLMRR